MARLICPRNPTTREYPKLPFDKAKALVVPSQNHKEVLFLSLKGRGKVRGTGRLIVERSRTS